MRKDEVTLWEQGIGQSWSEGGEFQRYVTLPMAEQREEEKDSNRRWGHLIVRMSIPTSPAVAQAGHVGLTPSREKHHEGRDRRQAVTGRRATTGLLFKLIVHLLLPLSINSMLKLVKLQ